MKPEGFDLGNSPSEYGAGPPLGETLVLATTNGTRAIVAAAADAEAVLIGSLANLTACAAAAARIARDGERDVLVQCAGVEGAFALDDAYVAGRFVAELRVWLAEWGTTDAATAAEVLADAFPSSRGRARRRRAAPPTCARPASPRICGRARARARSTSSRGSTTSTPASPSSPPQRPPGSDPMSAARARSARHAATLGSDLLHGAAVHPPQGRHRVHPPRGFTRWVPRPPLAPMLWRATAMEGLPMVRRLLDGEEPWAYESRGSVLEWAQDHVVLAVSCGGHHLVRRHLRDDAGRRALVIVRSRSAAYTRMCASTRTTRLRAPCCADRCGRMGSLRPHGARRRAT